MSGGEDLLKQKLRKIFNLRHFVNNKQKEAVKAVLKRDQDALISMGPGNRKSLCFQLPGIMQENKITIVCSASSSSIRNQIHYLKKSKISAVSITSQLSDDEQQRLSDDVTKDKPTIRFIYVKPELLSSDFFTNILRILSASDKLAYFAVDDAHLASPSLQGFCQDYLKFGSLRPAYPSVPWITLTHNASADVRNDIVRNLQLREPVAQFTKSTFRKNVHYDIMFKNTILDLFDHLKNFLISRLDTDDKKPAGIIYCKNRETVDMVAGKLTEIGFSTKAHHGGMTSSERKKVLSDWQSGVLPVVTATTSFGDGIEKSAVRVVVHFDVPQSITGLYKESGVAGRDGKLSYSRIYYCKSDVKEVDATLRNGITESKNENARRKALRAHADFLKMSDLCETIDCRHKIFSNYFGDTEPKCIDKCDVCTNPREATVALGLFHRLSATATGGSDMATFSPVIKDEPQDPVNGQEHRELGTLPTAAKPFRPVRSVSPANTIIKEENTATGNQTNVSIVSAKVFAMKTMPPGNVSPARTIVKEEFENVPNGMGPNFEHSASDSNVLSEDSKAGIRLISPRRCVSPAETIIDEKPVLHGLMSAISDSSNTTFSGSVPPSCNNAVIIKSEPKSPMRPIDGSDRQPLDNAVIIKSEPKSPMRPIDGSDREPLEQAIISLTPFSAAEITNPAEMLNSIAPTVTSDAIRGIDPFLPVTKQEAMETQSMDAIRTVSDRGSRSPSPSGTIVKDECLSPARNTDFDLDSPKNFSNVCQDVEDISKKLNADSERNRIKGRHELKATTKPPYKKINSQMNRAPSSEPEFVSSEIVDFRDNRSTIGSISRQRNRIVSSIKRSRSRSRSKERFKRENDRRRRSRSNERRKREKNARRRSRSHSVSSRERLKRETESRRRSRSNDRLKREKNVDRKPASSSINNRSQTTFKPQQMSKRERYSKDSDTDGIDDPNFSTPSASTSTKSKRKSQWSNIRFSVSPEKTERKTESEDDDKACYGYEDPPPPKPKLEEQPKSALLDVNILKEVQELASTIANEFDFDVIKARQEKMYQRIEDSIARNVESKLISLDDKIKEKKDAYVARLFGTNNFDHFDNDPALSNVDNVKKLQEFKALVPDDRSLYDKMSMKQEATEMQRKATRTGSELVLNGRIKEIEQQYPGGQGMPPHLTQQVKQEKEVLAEWVRKYLLPYYHGGRIRSKESFAVEARRICHHFYEHTADENIIRRYVDDMFAN